MSKQTSKQLKSPRSEEEVATDDEAEVQLSRRSNGLTKKQKEDLHNNVTLWDKKSRLKKEIANQIMMSCEYSGKTHKLEGGESKEEAIEKLHGLKQYFATNRGRDDAQGRARREITLLELLSLDTNSDEIKAIMAKNKEETAELKRQMEAPPATAGPVQTAKTTHVDPNDNDAMILVKDLEEIAQEKVEEKVAEMRQKLEEEFQSMKLKLEEDYQEKQKRQSQTLSDEEKQKLKRALDEHNRVLAENAKLRNELENAQKKATPSEPEEKSDAFRSIPDTPNNDEIRLEDIEDILDPGDEKLDESPNTVGILDKIESQLQDDLNTFQHRMTGKNQKALPITQHHINLPLHLQRLGVRNLHHVGYVTPSKLGGLHNLNIRANPYHQVMSKLVFSL